MQIPVLIEKLRSFGLSPEQVLEVVELVTKRTANAERQARFRARQRGTNQESVISNVTQNSPPKAEIHSQDNELIKNDITDLSTEQSVTNNALLVTPDARPLPPYGFPPTYKNNTTTLPSYNPPSREALPRKSDPKRTDGTRLSPDWTPKQHTDRTEALEKFRDYWTAQPGIKGRKVDWDATWRNWIRRENTTYGGKKPGERDLRSVPDKLLSNDDYWRKRRQLETWG
jgi:hypothetical protein